MDTIQHRLNIISQHVYQHLPPHHNTKLIEKFSYDADAGHVVSKLYSNGCLKIILNRPEALNALSLEMLQRLNSLLRNAAVDPKVKLVILKSSSDRAFSAGGDIKKIIKSSVECNAVWHHNLFNLARRIYRFPKPYIALQNGLCMGAGVGISIYGRYRVIGPNFLWAMPEVGIGLFPDIGGSYFLNSLTPCSAVGHYLGLTGARITSPADALFASIATHYVASTETMAQVEEALCSNETMSTDLQQNHQQVEAILRAFSSTPSPTISSASATPKSGRAAAGGINATTTTTTSLRDLLPQIVTAFSFPTPLTQCFEDVLRNLREDGSPWANECIRLMSTKSPHSLKVTFEQLLRGEEILAGTKRRGNSGSDQSHHAPYGLDIRETASTGPVEACLVMEYKLMKNMLQSHDFAEGVRAAVVDKDNNPQWEPKSLEEVTPQMVQKAFESERVLQFD